MTRPTALTHLRHITALTVACITLACLLALATPPPVYASAAEAEPGPGLLAALAFATYLAFGLALTALGRMLAGRRAVPTQSVAPYASGEAPPTNAAPMNARDLLLTALCFATLHLGALILSTNAASWVAVVYAAGLFVLVAVIWLG